MTVEQANGTCAHECRAFLLRKFAELGVEVHVTTEKPIVPSRYEELDLRCPHDVLWYAEPTGDQIAKWAADGVK